MTTELPDLDAFFIVEDETTPTPVTAAPEQVVTSGGVVLRRRPTDPGYILTWTEYPSDNGSPPTGGYRRTGMVLAPAPTPGSAWVVPDEPRDGDGYAVIVRDVTWAGGDREPVRIVGAAGDYRSTAGWQSPRTLPRALLRVDRVTVDGGDGYRVWAVHGDPVCRPVWAMRGERVTRGALQPLPDAYVYGNRLHTLSQRPVHPDTGRLVDLCRLCLPWV